MPKKLKNKRLVLALVLGGVLLGPLAAPAQAITEFRVVIKSLKAEVALSAGPPSLAFGNVNVGQTGTSSITVTNAGGTTADDVQYQVTPSNSGFILNGGCGPSLGPGQSCTESVTFAPTAGQSYEGLFTASGASQSSTVSLSGTGLLAQNQVNAGSLTFASYAVGATSPAQTVTLSNPGNTALSGVNARTSGPYAATSNCTSSLAPNGSCSINVTFTPTVMNSNPGNLFIDSALGTQTLALSGTGLKAIDQFSVTSLAFGNQSVGVASTAKSFTITNPGNINLGISQVTPQGPFAVSSNTCGASLAPNATCTIGVTFTPTAIGNASGGAVNVVTSAGSQAISLSGTGTQARLSASPTSLAFGGVFAGNSSAAQSVTLTNSGNVAATSLVIAAPNGYTQTNTCGTSLAAQSSCNISVTFSPATSGAFNANLTATSSVPTVSVPLSGTGVCSPGFQVFTSNGTFTPRPGCSTNLVLVVGGGGGGAALSFAGGGGGAGGVGVQFANGLTTAQAITIGGGGAGGARSNGNAGGAGGTSCFAGICAGGGAGAGTNGIGGGGGSGGGRGNGAMSNGGSSGSASSDGSAGGQGNYASFIALFRDVSVTAGAGGAGYASPFTAANDAGGGGGGILLNGGGASGGGGLIGGDSAFPANGGTGYGAGGGGGQWQCQSQCQPGGGGAGAQGVVYVEWSQ